MSPRLLEVFQDTILCYINILACALLWPCLGVVNIYSFCLFKKRKEKKKRRKTFETVVPMLDVVL